MKTTLLYFLLCIEIIQALIQGTKKKFTVNALDCRTPSHIISWEWGSLCAPTSQIQDEDTENVLILQMVPEKLVKAGRCERRTSRFTLFCGAFSHSKLSLPPDILKSEPLSISECKTLVEHNVYMVSGTILNVPMNGKGIYKGYEHGKVEFGQNNVYCQGADIDINGERHTSVVVYVTTEVMLTQVDILSSGLKTEDTDLRIALPATCILDGACEVDTYTYVLIDKVDLCKLQEVRMIPMTKYMLPHGGSLRLYYVNKLHKVILRKSEVFQVTGCPGLSEVFKTEHEYVFILPLSGENKPSVPSLSAGSIDLDLEIKVSEEYLLFRMEQVLVSRFSSLSQKLCQMNLHSLRTLERSPFHDFAIIRIRGQLVQELTCDQVTVDIIENDSRGILCYDNLIPVTLKGKELFLDAGSLVLVEDGTLHQVSCSSMYTAVLKTKEGFYIQANPAVQVIDIKISDMGFLHSDDETVDHEEEGNSILYSTEELQAFHDLMHFSRVRSQVLDGLVRNYCQNPSACGYQSTNSGGFDINGFIAGAMEPLDWWNWILAQLTIVGQVASVLVLLYVVWRTISSWIHAILDGRKYNVSTLDAYRTNYNLRDELKTLLYEEYVPVGTIPSRSTPGSRRRTRSLPPTPRDDFAMTPIPVQHPDHLFALPAPETLSV